MTPPIGRPPGKVSPPGETDQWTPYLYQNTTQIFPWVGKKDYNLITDMADEAIDHGWALD